MDVREKARRLRELHGAPPVLVLPNAWDAASARLFAEAGFQAIGTTSGGMAYTLGYPDGERTPLNELLFLLRRIVATVDLPVTADMESGYGRDPAAVSETTRAVLAEGVVGMNLEDAEPGVRGRLVELDDQLRKLEAALQAAESEGIPLVLNARTDVFIREVGAPSERLKLAVERANAYRDVGADCLFVPGVRDAETIRELAERIHGPLNVLVGPGTPPVSELESLGVARVSLGSGPARAAMGLCRNIAEELREDGTYQRIIQAGISHKDANQLFDPPFRRDEVHSGP